MLSLTRSGLNDSFLFTGMQNINWIPPQPHPGTPFDIIQPVLQVSHMHTHAHTHTRTHAHAHANKHHATSTDARSMVKYGPSAAGGWDYWAIASWYVTLTDDVVYSDIQTVQSGDVIFGTLVLRPLRPS